MNAVPHKTLIVEAALELGIDPAFVEKDGYVVQVIREMIRTLSNGNQGTRTMSLPPLLRPVSSLVVELTKARPGMSYAAGGLPTFTEALAKVKALVDHLVKE